MAKTSKKKTTEEVIEVVSVRRAPKLFAFMSTGAIVGMILAVVLYLVASDEQKAQPGILGFLIVYIGGAGFVAGTLVSLGVDRISRARAKQIEATKLKG
jgi:high-affinity Fe2+/Pb2+ permease